MDTESIQWVLILALWYYCVWLTFKVSNLSK